VEGCGQDGELVNQFLSHLVSRAFSPATVRAYAYDLFNLLRFLTERCARLGDVVATDLFDYLDWQPTTPPPRPGCAATTGSHCMSRRTSSVIPTQQIWSAQACRCRR
jgi:site-specific recombinase XerD